MEKKLKNHFRIKKMFSSLLLSYGALVMLPFISVFVLLQFWNASTEKYYKEIVDHSLTEGRMAFEKGWTSSMQALFLSYMTVT